MPDPRVNVVLGAKDEATKVVTGLRGQFEKFKKDAVTGFGLGAGIGVFNLATRAVGAVTDALGEATRMAMEEEAEIARLTTSIGENSAAWDGNIQAIEDLLTERQRLGFSDSEQRTSLASLVAVTKDHTVALDLNRQAMDLARLRGMSLSDASELLGKVYGGNTSILRRYGIRVRQGATATEALAEVQKMAADQAEAFADTSLGAWTALELKIEDVKEAVGKQLLPAMDSLTVGIDAALDPVGTASLLFGLLQSQMEGNTVAFEAVWRASKDLAPQLGLTAEGWRETIQTADDSNRSFTDFADSIKMRIGQFAAFRAEQEALGFVFDEVTARWSKAPAEMARALRPIPGVVAAARDDALHEAMQFGPSLRDTIKASKDEIREAMTDVRWAMEHPFAGDRLARYMEDKAQAMNRKLITALRQGKTDAAEETGDIVNAILSELSVLEGQNYSIGVAMRFREQQKRGSFGQGEANRRAGRRAHGGPVSAGQTFLVGENGPEFLHMGSQSGHVTPDGGSMRPIVVNVDGHELFRIMDARGGSRYATAGRGSYYRTAE